MKKDNFKFRFFIRQEIRKRNFIKLKLYYWLSLNLHISLLTSRDLFLLNNRYNEDYIIERFSSCYSDPINLFKETIKDNNKLPWYYL